MMKFVGLWVVVILTISGCATGGSNLAYRANVDAFIAGHARNTAPIPAPTNLEPKPWQLGQWALYKKTQADGKVDYERVSVVALDSCGTWIERMIQNYDGLWRWTVCVRPPRDASVTLDDLQVVITEMMGSELGVFDFRDGQAAGAKRFEWIVSDLAAPWRGNFGLAREDLDVPAGHVSQAVKRTSLDRGVRVTIWSHPEVPFDGMVKQLSEGRMVELLEYGDQGVSGAVSRLALELAALEHKPQVRSGGYLGLGYGVGRFSDTQRTAETITGQLGRRVAPRLDLLVVAEGITLERYAPDPTLSQSAGLGLLAVRWSPFRPLHYRPAAASRCRRALRPGRPRVCPAISRSY